MNIGIDIDNTMYNLDVIEQVSLLTGTNYKTQNLTNN